MISLASSLYRGGVRHRRFAPRERTFAYSTQWCWLDLTELDALFSLSPLWSQKKWAPVRFVRSDFLGDPERDLAECVRDAVQAHCNERPLGPIRLLTQLRYWGYSFNPVSIYYCYHPDGVKLHSIVAEITNTPWLERHHYVLPVGESVGNARLLRWKFSKSFHVSPFMGMSQEYDWRFTVPDKKLFVHMENFENGARVFDATLSLDRFPWTRSQLHLAFLRHPAMTVKVITSIYWQATLLWLRKTPFHSHP